MWNRLKSGSLRATRKFAFAVTEGAEDGTRRKREERRGLMQIVISSEFGDFI
jgi:hypothetical protein